MLRAFSPVSYTHPAEFGYKVTPEDFEQISRATPHLVNVKPSGKYSMIEFDECGGVAAVIQALGEKFLDMNAKTVNGIPIGQYPVNINSLLADVITTPEHPLHQQGSKMCIRDRHDTIRGSGHYAKYPCQEVANAVLKFVSLGFTPRDSCRAR